MDRRALTNVHQARVLPSRWSHSRFGGSVAVVSNEYQRLARTKRHQEEAALLELEDIVRRVRTMAAVSYDLDIEEVWEF